VDAVETERAPDAVDCANAGAEDAEGDAETAAPGADDGVSVAAIEDDDANDTPPIGSPEQAKAVLECLLFTTTEPLPMRRLQSLLRPLDYQAILDTIVAVEQDYRGRGLQIKEVAGGYLMATRPEFADWVTRLYRNRRRRALTKTMLETLAIVAYRQPIIKAEIDAIRGVDSAGVLRNLLDLDLIDARDRRDVIGRPLQYRTTQAFMKAFGLKSLSELPTIQELRALRREGEFIPLGAKPEPAAAPAPLEQVAAEDGVNAVDQVDAVGQMDKVDSTDEEDVQGTPD
jgi:segregation and condensation protein B